LDDSFIHLDNRGIQGREKTRTRRRWDDKYAHRLIAGIPRGKIHDAYDRNPRFGGKKIGTFIIVSMKKEHMSTMPDEDYETEGFKFMEEDGIKIWGKEPRQAFEDWKKTDETLWVVDFEIKSILNSCGHYYLPIRC
jgi:hypothetical protein